MLKKLIAEFVGTFTLSLVVLLSVTGTFPLPLPLLAALVLMLFVYTIGTISGSHINPAVTIGLWSVKKIGFIEALGYIVAQVLGGAAALFLATKTLAFGLPPIMTAPAFLLFEFLGMIIFVMGIAAVVNKNVSAGAAGVVVGGSLLLGIAVSALGGAAGILNPAVGLALLVSGPGYYIAEITGSIVGFQLYGFLTSKKKDSMTRVKSLFIFGGIALLIFAGSLWFTGRTNHPTGTAAAPSPEVNLVLGVFSGKTPCADCSEIDTTLTLTMSAPYSAEGTYTLSMLYVGKAAKPFITTGQWTTLRGTPTNPNAVVYELDPNKPNEAQYYLKVDENTLRPLDKQENEITTPFNMDLKRS